MAAQSEREFKVEIIRHEDKTGAMLVRSSVEGFGGCIVVPIDRERQDRHQGERALVGRTMS
jgi:hypothetical protein